jgi:hypothetical protein
MRPPGKSLILEPWNDDGLFCPRVTSDVALPGSAFSSEPVFGSSTDCVRFGKGRDEGNWKKSNCGVADRTCQYNNKNKRAAILSVQAIKRQIANR